MNTSVILYRAHVINETVNREVACIKEQLSGIDVFVVGYTEQSHAEPASNGILMYGREHLESLGYIQKCKTVDWNNSTGHNDLPVMRFYRDHPAYSHYWVIEYDVRYTGNWKDFFDELALSDADLLATNILDYRQLPEWHWWSAEQLPPSVVALESRIKAFLPFFRISNRALRAIDMLYQTGWSGHYEMAFPTICKISALTVEDIGGNGCYTPEPWKNKHYLSNVKSFSLFPGTFVFKPSFGDYDVRTYGADMMGAPMLWHPIK